MFNHKLIMSILSMSSEQISIPLSHYRGGTSKALFLHEKDVPPPGASRDKVLKRLMGSPDPMQIDGMGGTHIVTSKIALIRPSTRPDADVDYTFCQVSIEDDLIAYDGNCGNISAAVGPFSITEGLVKEFREGQSVEPSVKTQDVRVYVTGTKKILTEHIPVDQNGKVVQTGDFAIAGCPGTGAPILLDYKDTIGGACDRGALPTGRTVDRITTSGGQDVEYTVCDVANIIVFARAADLGINGNEAPGVLDKDSPLIAKVKELRGKVAQAVGMCKNWENVDTESPALPMVALVSPATTPEGHIQSRLFLDNKCHTAMAGTGSVCHAACSRIPGTIVNQMLRPGTEKENVLNIQHPSGIMPAAVTLKNAPTGGQVPDFKTLSFVRTARRILKGDIDVPDNVKADFVSSMRALATESTADEVQVEGDISPTTAFAQFASTFTASSLPPEVTETIKKLFLDYIGVATGATRSADSTPSFLAALDTLSVGQTGTSTPTTGPGPALGRRSSRFPRAG